MSVATAARRLSGVAVLLALGACATPPPAPPTPVHSVTSLAGVWENESGHATLTINPEGWYELVTRRGETVRRSTGRLRVEAGRVTYRSQRGVTGAMILYGSGTAPVLVVTTDRPAATMEFRPVRASRGG